MSMTVQKNEQDQDIRSDSEHLRKRLRRAEARCAEMEDALARSRAAASALLNATPDMACIIDADGTVIAANPALEECMGIPLGSAPGRNAFDMLPGLLCADSQDACLKALESNSLAAYAFDAGDRRMELNVHPLGWEDRRGMVVFVRDVTRQRRTKEELQAALQRTAQEVQHRTGELEQSRQLLEKIFQSLNEAVLVADYGSRRISDCNFAATTIFGYSRDELLGLSMDDLYMDPDECEAKSLDGSSVAEHCRILDLKECHMRGKDGAVITAEHSTSPLYNGQGGQIAWVSVVRDMSRRRRLQAEAMRAGHLASVGELAAGVAHEINNPITGIINYGQILLDTFEETGNPEDRRIPKRIIAEGERIASIVRNLLFFSRSNKQERAPIDVGDILRDALDLTGKLMEKDGVLVSTVIAENLPLCYGRSRELQQVFLNLLSNARHGLNLKFAQGDLEKKLELTVFTDAGEGGTKVFVRIMDYGVGIAEKILDRVCEPFFSTKPEGEGTGLGLSISYGILREHGGRLHFSSREGEFTQVTVELPVWGKDL